MAKEMKALTINGETYEIVDEYARSNSGSGSSAELEDIRLGADGKKFGTAGEAVRQQFRYVGGQIDHIEEEIQNIDSVFKDICYDSDGYKYSTPGDTIRMQFDSVKHSMENIDESIDHVIDLFDIIHEEVYDARIGADGVEYETAGEAVRTQFSNIVEKADNNAELLNNIRYGINNVVYPTPREAILSQIRDVDSDLQYKYNELKGYTLYEKEVYLGFYNKKYISGTDFEIGDILIFGYNPTEAKEGTILIAYGENTTNHKINLITSDETNSKIVRQELNTNGEDFPIKSVEVVGNVTVCAIKKTGTVQDLKNELDQLDTEDTYQIELISDGVNPTILTAGENINYGTEILCYVQKGTGNGEKIEKTIEGTGNGVKYLYNEEEEFEFVTVKGFEYKLSNNVLVYRVTSKPKNIQDLKYELDSKRIVQGVHIVDSEYYTYGDDTLQAILDGKQILIKVPNKNDSNLYCNFMPVIQYQLPNNNDYLTLFYLKDGIAENIMTAMTTGSFDGVFGEITMKLSKKYTECPLK